MYVPKHQVERRLLLDVVVTQRAAILELLTRENQTLLIRRDALLILDLGLHIVNRIRRLNLKGDRLASQGLDEDLHGGQRQSTVRRKGKGGAVQRTRLAPLRHLRFCSFRNESRVIVMIS